MDLDEWEYLPDDGFLDFHEESEEKRIFSSKSYSDSKSSVFNMNYFIIPSPPMNSRAQQLPNNQLVPVPIQLELPPRFGKPPEDESPDVKKVSKVAPIDDGKRGLDSEADDPDTQLSQVYFKKTWEGEFADMKMDSPKSPTCRSPKFMHPQNDKFQFDDKLGEACTSPRILKIEKNNMGSEDSKEEEEDGGDDVTNGNTGNNNIWKLSSTGIGAICSFGFAAATICILFFGTHHKNKQYQRNQNRFQIYTDDNKRIKQAVHQATRLNDAFSAVRGVPLTQAHVTFGGYYNGL